MKKLKDSKKPFFSKLLEAQKLEETKDVKGGADWPFIGPPYDVTMKYPSDNDEEGPAA